jgi:hypothetical protein
MAGENRRTLARTRLLSSVGRRFAHLCWQGRGRKGIVAGDGEDRRMAMLDDALTDLRRSLSNGSTRARLTARNVGTYWACAGA